MRFWVLWSLATVMSLGACGSSKSDSKEQAANETPSVATAAGGQQAPTGATDELCPLRVKDTTAIAEDVDGGVAIRFTTTGDVAEVRRLVTARAAMHAGRRGGGGMGMGMRGMAASQGRPAMNHPEMMAADVKTEEVDGGARVVFTPKDPARLEALRSEVRDHAARMAATGQCPMMMHRGQP